MDAGEHSMTRRAAIASGVVGAGAAALGGGEAMAQAGARKTFVLIHGAYHGGWCWKKVDRNPRRQGPQGLCAVADRARRPLASALDQRQPHHPHHRRRQPVQMGRHHGRLPGAALLRRLAGLGALEHIGDRVSSIVWLDAFMPKDGEASTDQISAFSRKALEEALAKGEPGRKPPKANAYSISEKTTTGSTQAHRSSRTGRCRRRSSSPARCRR